MQVLGWAVLLCAGLPLAAAAQARDAATPTDSSRSAQQSGQAAAADSVQVPPEVLRSFRVLYPKLHDQQWTQHGGTTDEASEWRTEYQADGLRTRIRFAADGTLVGIRRFYKAAQLPHLVREAAHQEQPGYRIMWGSEWVPNGGRPTHFKVYLRQGDKQVALRLRPDGSALSAAEVPREALVDEETN